MVALVALRLPGLLVRVEDNPDGIQVVHFLEGDLFLLHLVPHGIGRLHPLFDLELEAGFLQGLFDGLHKGGHFSPFIADVLVDAGLHLFIGFGLLVTQPDVLQLGLDPVQAQTVRQGDEDEHGFAQDLVPLVLRHMLDGTAVMQAVGQFDEDHANVIVQGEKDALEILGLQALLGNVRAVGLLLIVQHVLDLGETVHEGGDLVAETFADVFHGIIRVFHHIVQQRGSNGLVSQADIVHHDARHGNGVQHIGLSAAAPDIAMCIVGELKGPPYHLHLFCIGAAFFGRQTQQLIVVGYQVVIFLGKLGETHSLILFLRRSLRARTASAFISSSISTVVLCWSTFWKA